MYLEFIERDNSWTKIRHIFIQNPIEISYIDVFNLKQDKNTCNLVGRASNGDWFSMNLQLDTPDKRVYSIHWLLDPKKYDKLYLDYKRRSKLERICR